MKVFVPVTDDMLQREDFTGLLVPYRPGRLLVSQCRKILEPCQSSRNTSLSPGASSSSDALPALSSSTYLAGPSLG